MKKKFKFRISMFSGIVLAVVLLSLFGADRKKDNFLFDPDSHMVLYVKTEAGKAPVFKAEEFFPDEEIDTGRFDYDMNDCDWNVPGTYQIPVIYDGRETNCRIQLEVTAKEADEGNGLPPAWEDGTTIKQG